MAKEQEGKHNRFEEKLMELTLHNSATPRKTSVIISDPDKTRKRDL